jgi:L-fucose isomerase-like protein
MKTRVYVAFVSKEKGKEGWPSSDFDPKLRRDYLLHRLESACKNIEFIGKDIIQNFSELKKIEKKTDIDGILVYTLATFWYKSWARRRAETTDPDVLAFRRYPMILVSDRFGGEQLLFDFYDWASRNKLLILPISSSNFEDLVKALHLIEVIHQIKKSKILIVGKSGESLDQSHWWRQKSEEYFKTLKEVFGIEVITIDSEELNEYYQSVDKNSAHKIAEEWLNKASKVVEPGEEEIVKSARMYLAMKKAMEKVKADAITIDCLTLFYEGKLPAYPCLGFAQLNDEGSTGICEADLDGTVTQLVLRYLTRRPGFISDPVIDTSTQQIIYAHCTAPTKMFGKEGISAPFIIRSHAEDNKGAALQVIMPPNETVTTAKLNVLNKKVVIHQGKTKGNINEERACRTKLIAGVNAKKIFKNYRYGIFGWHRVTVYGDFREGLSNLATLLGLEIIEEDR